ncbi:Protein CBG07864 [Caenorhabditis briggsae]|uniref:Protein CBG07864 n=1 Tax=Caenorhabditis briggsae TaxID=6238 RepID=A8X5A9_CAEBR|nr:Protein CBG07864 [Caenorhabditis briggsae]CAP27808.2 Protein CBG07864 [Caenorhabditis briggsae]
MNTLTFLLILSLTIGMAYSISNSEKLSMSDNQANFFSKIFKNIQGPQNAKNIPPSRLWVHTSAKDCGTLSRIDQRYWCRDNVYFLPLGMLRTLHQVKSVPRVWL